MTPEEMRQIVRDEVRPIAAKVDSCADKVDRLEERLFVGTPERQSLQEEIAHLKASNDGTRETVRELRAQAPDKDFAKKIAAIVLALITTAGAVYGAAQAVSPAKANADTHDTQESSK
jgi:chorismate mutase